MPIKVPDSLPAKDILQKENIFIMDESRAFKQDIRPLQIGILNLMPDKQAAEVQLLRHLGNTPIQIDITLLRVESRVSKHTPFAYLSAFYKTFDEIKNRKFDGFIITGAPVELLEFEEVDYWNELMEIMEWTKTNTTSCYHICWGAQAGLNYHYGLKKYKLEKKLFGVFTHYIKSDSVDLFRGFDDIFYVPHSRHTEIKSNEVKEIDDLVILSESQDAGLYIVASKDYSKIFVMGHSEYDPATLNNEYTRDLKKGEDVSMPENYFFHNNPDYGPFVRWRSHASLLYNNWVNMVYQMTPYDIEEIGNNR